MLVSSSTLASLSLARLNAFSASSTSLFLASSRGFATRLRSSSPSAFCTIARPGASFFDWILRNPSANSPDFFNSSLKAACALYSPTKVIVRAANATINPPVTAIDATLDAALIALNAAADLPRFIAKSIKNTGRPLTIVLNTTNLADMNDRANDAGSIAATNKVNETIDVRIQPGSSLNPFASFSRVSANLSTYGDTVPPTSVTILPIAALARLMAASLVLPAIFTIAIPLFSRS